MKKRLILLIGFVFIMCGCTANVDINITHDGIEEKVSITALEDGIYTKEQIKEGFRKNVPVFYDVIVADTEADIPKNGVTYYVMNQQDLGTGYNTTYSYKFPMGQYSNSTAVKSAFRSFQLKGYSKPVSSKLPEEKRKITISSDITGLKVFNTYPKLENVNINIRTDYKVLESNADSEKDGIFEMDKIFTNENGIYTWNFTSSNKKGIYMVLDNTLEDGEAGDPEGVNGKKSEKEKSFFDEHPILTGVIAIGVFLFAALILSKIKK